MPIAAPRPRVRPQRNAPAAKIRPVPSMAIPLPLQPTQEQIRRRAYEIFVARGSAPGNSDSDWLQAEAELRGRLALLGRT